MLFRLATLVLILLGILLGWLTLAVSIPFWIPAAGDRLIHVWNNDLALLEKHRSLPKQWSEIGSLEIIPANEGAKNLLEESGKRPNIAVKKDGRFKIEIEVIHWQERPYYGATLQYHLVDTQSKNTVWEFGRTLKVGFIY